jgi:hypothetical protein
MKYKKENVTFYGKLKEVLDNYPGVEAELNKCPALGLILYEPFDEKKKPDRLYMEALKGAIRCAIAILGLKEKS